MAGTTTDQIVELLEQGETRTEIIAMGYKKATVAITDWTWWKGMLKASCAAGKETALTSASEPTTAVPPPIVNDIESDPEIPREGWCMHLLVLG